MVSPIPDVVVVVSGLPRSGTSMMMKMLEAGGIPILTDNLRTADSNNPEGYYEFERVKKLPQGDTAWVADAHGKAVKVISALLQHLPTGHEYRVLFMRRSLPEILASQRKMLESRGRPTDQTDDGEMTRLFERHLQEIDTWIRARPNIRSLEVPYNGMLKDAEPLVAQVNSLLDSSLDTAAMLEAINPDLYRNRAPRT